jgi:hypothetical protein
MIIELPGIIRHVVRNNVYLCYQSLLSLYIIAGLSSDANPSIETFTAIPVPYLSSLKEAFLAVKHRPFFEHRSPMEVAALSVL